MVEKRIKSAVPIYAVGVSFILASLFLPPFKLSYLFINTGIAVIVYVIVYKFAPSKIIMVEAPVKKADTGDKTADEIITNARNQLKEIKNLGKLIENGEFVTQLDEVNYYGNKMMDYLESHIEKTSEIRRFTEYYLPTTLKLVNDYVKFKSQGAAGENIEKAVKKIEGVMGTVSHAYKNQYDNLFEDNSIDIVAEVNVMEKLLKAEGLTDENNMGLGSVSERRDK